MEDIKEMALNCVEIIYYVRTKGKVIVFITTCLIMATLWAGLSFLLSFVVCTAFKDANAMPFWNCFILIGCLGAIVALMNANSENADIVKVFLEHNYLRKKLEPLGFISLIKAIFVVLLLYEVNNILVSLVERLCGIVGLSEIGEVVILFVVYIGVPYLLITETIIDPLRRCRVKACAALIIFFMLLALYGNQLSSNSEIGESDIWGTIIFMLSILALLDAALVNYRDMYKMLRSQYENDLVGYMVSIPKKYDEKYKCFKGEVSAAKECLTLFKEIWRNFSTKKKVSFVVGATIMTGFALILMFISLKASKYMIVHS